MTLGQQATERGQVARRERRRRLEHARVLGDDVTRGGSSATCSSVASRRESIPSRRATASHSARRAAYALSASVRGSPQCTTTTATSGAIGTGRTRVRPAIDEQRVPGAAEQRRELVHQATGHAGGLDFGGEREVRGVDRLEREPAEIGERER